MADDVDPTAAAEEPFYEALGAKIREARVQAGMTQEELGESVGLSRSSVANIEGGRQQPPTFTHVRIAKALGIDVGELFDKSAHVTPTELAALRKQRADLKSQNSKLRKKINRARTELDDDA